jgi:hypothetical protein
MIESIYPEHFILMKMVHDKINEYIEKYATNPTIVVLEKCYGNIENSFICSLPVIISCVEGIHVF